MSIRNTITPFSTTLPDIPVKDMQGQPNNALSRISIVKKTARIYDDGSSQIDVPVWGYQGTWGDNNIMGGPAIQVTSGKTLLVEWKNALTKSSKCPVDEVHVPFDEDADRIVPQNRLGAGEIKLEKKPSAYFVPHLHGAKTAPNYDGWPESMMMSGQSRLSRYENDERSTMYWYHDHAMHTTRLNAYAGLAAPYIIRDKEERLLNLPKGRDEIFLVIQDRNLNLPEKPLCKGVNKTTLLHKTETNTGPLEFYGPLTLVNGAIWPKRTVDDGLYRLRILNSSNSRVYALYLVETKADRTLDLTNPKIANKPRIVKIGTDGGLLDNAVELTQFTDKGAIVLMPAERIDLLIDFSQCKNKSYAFVNAATSPFSGSDSIRAINASFYPATPDEDTDRNPYPEVMRFDVCEAMEDHKDTDDLKCIIGKMKKVVKTHYYNPAKVKKTRTIALVEKDMGLNKPAMLTNLELIEEAELKSYKGAANRPYQALKAGRLVEIDGVKYRVCAERFQDPLNFQVVHGDTEIWRFINISPDSHPMHLHLVQYRHHATHKLAPIEQVDGTGNVVETEGNGGMEAADIVNGAFRAGDSIRIHSATSTPAVNETGLKDTIRVDPGTMVEIIAKFEGHLGRYLYHCHLLEHEDHDMMRQFVVARPDMRMHSKDVPGSIGK